MFGFNFKNNMVVQSQYKILNFKSSNLYFMMMIFEIKSVVDTNQIYNI